jgi:hypothetical protein
MSIKFVARRVEALPPLAWIAVLPRSDTDLNVLHGPSVELFADGFFEGAWDGRFTDGGFDQAVNVFGSGGKLGQDTVALVGPSHTLEPLYIASTDRLSAASNSLPFLLYHCGLRFDPYDFSYGTALSAIANGLDHTPRRIMLRGGFLTVLYHHNAVLTSDGAITVVAKALPPSFPSFDSYSSYLRGLTARVFQNADDPARRFRYRPISTISSGYDSPAATAVARSCGCNESIGLRTSNMGEPDSGQGVAESLGMEHTDFERVERASGENLVEAEFLASGMQAGDLIYSVFEEKLAGRIATTGFHGDKVWEKSNPPNRVIKRSDISGCSLGEFRLRVNFLHLPMAFIGSQRHHDIHRISNSPEMADFSLGGGYDRPVPRRILEEAGVDRSSFAQAKRAASVFLFEFHRRLSPTARQRIAAYCRKEKLYPQYMLVLGPKILWWTFGRNLYRVLRRLRKILGVAKEHTLAKRLARIGTALFGIKAPVFSSSHPRFTILLMWAVSEIGRRYAPSGQSPLAHSTEYPRYADSGIVGAVNAPERD